MGEGGGIFRKGYGGRINIIWGRGVSYLEGYSYMGGGGGYLSTYEESLLSNLGPGVCVCADLSKYQYCIYSCI